MFTGVDRANIGGWNCRTLLLRTEKDVENFANRDLVQTFPADRLVRMQLIDVATPDPAAGQVTALDQIRNETVRRPLLDPHAFGDLPDPDSGVARDAVERMQVISQKAPFSHASIITVIGDMSLLTCLMCRPNVAVSAQESPTVDRVADQAERERPRPPL